MKKIILITLPLALAVSCAPKGDPQLGKAPIGKVIAAMTNEEKAHIVVGTGMAGFTGDDAVVGETRSIVPGAAGTSYPIPRLGIPAVVLADGPAGLRISPVREGDDQTYYCTHFPIGTLLASTWNTELVEQVGEAMGNEVLEYGADVLLAPALNIHRNPLCGRNFEYYSEDPVIAGKIAAAYVRGIQSNGVGTSVKHFAFNNQETNRMQNDAHIDPRTAREIYLKGFEITVKESDPWTVMSSYNKINGTYTSESTGLLTDILRDEWGYKGMVMTDWFGGKNALAQMEAGNDMLQPGRPEQYESILKGLNDGTLESSYVDRNIRRILEMILRTPRFKGYEYSNKPDLKAHAEVTRESATEGMVLLKNEGATLPLAENVKKIALFGNTSYNFIAGGTGSGNVNHAYVVSLTEGLANAGYVLDKALEKKYLNFIEKETARLNPKSDDPMAMFKPKVMPGEYIPTSAELKALAAASDVAVITLGRNSGEFLDRKVEDFNLSASEVKMMNSVCSAFHSAGKKVIVVLNIGGVIETSSWKKLPDAILCAWQGGQEGGNSVADILCGKVSPSGKLPMTFPVAYQDHASSSNFPTEGVVLAMFGKDANGQLEKNVDYTDYEEGIYVGYRWFDKQNMIVSYPFGYGLSYTSFEFTNASLKQKGGRIIVSVDVTNTGKTAGKEVVQLYVTAPEGSMDKPVKELKAFAKTALLAPGETQTVQMTVNSADLASFDIEKSAWVVDAGEYDFLVAASSRDIKFSLPAIVKASETATHRVLVD